MRTWILLVALAFAPAVWAQEGTKAKVGSDAPDFDASSAINAPEANTLEQCKGDVILIKLWGIN